MIFYHLVEPPGIEPGSKQAIQKLSTRLFPDWVFDFRYGQEQPPKAYLLKCLDGSEAQPPIGLFLRFSLVDRHKPGLSGRIRPSYLVGTRLILL